MSVPTPQSPTFLDRGVQQGQGALGRVVCQHRGVVRIAGVEPATRTAQQTVGIAGVEPATSPSRTGCSTKLSYTPTACWVTDQCPSPRWRSRLRVSDSDSPSRTGRSAKLSHTRPTCLPTSWAGTDCAPGTGRTGSVGPRGPRARRRRRTGSLALTEGALYLLSLTGLAGPYCVDRPRHGTATSGGLASVPSSHRHRP